jgi:hypothetical protein
MNSKRFFHRYIGTLCVVIAMILSANTTVYAAPKTKVSVVGKRGAVKVQCSFSKRKNRWKLNLNSRTQDKLRRRKISKKRANRACRSLVSPSAVIGLDKLPGVGKVANSFAKASVRLGSVVGTPPKLSDIPSMDVSNLFWNDGVVSRISSSTATPDDCNQFYGGTTDGASAGYAGCYMAMATGQIMEEAVRAGTSVCYMRNFPTVGEAGGVSVTSGSENLPDGDVTKIFESPEGSTARLVKVQISSFPGDEGPGDIFIEVAGQETNNANKDQYSYRMWFCNGGVASGSEAGRVGKNGKLTLSAEGMIAPGEGHSVSLNAYLIEEEGELTFNPNLERVLELSFSAQSFAQKGRTVFTAQNEIKTKSYMPNEGIRSYGVMSFQGSEVADVRFLDGAYKDEKENEPENGIEVGVEYRTDRYVAAPESNKVKNLRKVDLNSDPFYQEQPLTFDPSAFDCSASADVIVSLNFSTPELLAVGQKCAGESLDNMRFCFGGAVQTAESNFGTACSIQ